MNNKHGIGVLSLLLLTSFGTDAAKVYSWVDPQGVTHYTDAPPPGKNAKEVDMRVSPLVGTSPHSVQVDDFNHLTGADAKKAQEAAAKYAAQQHRYRANMIAETEMAFAYQHGEYEAVKMAQAQGLMGVVEKVWSTAYDDGVCDICNGLEGQTIGIDDNFNFKLNKLLFGGQRLTPPAHPQCRCAVEYREISPPVIQPAQSQTPGPSIPDPATRHA